MFRKQNNIFKIKFVVKYSFIIFITFGIVLNFTFSYEIKLGDALDRLQSSIKRNVEINKINGKAVVWDIYNKSLSMVKDSSSAHMLSAIDKTSYSLNSKKDNPCQLNNQDVVNIMYFANSTFKRDIKGSLVSFIKPTKSDMGKSCNKLNVCFFKPDGWILNNTPKLVQSCQATVEKEFVTFYVNSYYMATVWWSNVGSHYFWNFSLNDSSYDIMNDVNILAKILFQDVKEPVQTLFYKMPSIDYSSIYEEPKMNMNIDWFSPYNNYTATNNPINNNDNDTIQDDIWETLSTDVTNTSFKEVVDDDIKSFVESINFDISNPGIVVAGNQCVSWFEFQSSWSISSWSLLETMTPLQYLSWVLDDIAEVSCNKDGICQTWETTTCPDCINEWWNTDFEEIEALLNNAAEQSTGQVSPDDPILWCFQKCQSLPCNPLNCDKLVCYANCSCLTYDSPMFDPIKSPGLSSIFKIKFCPIPVMENKMTRNKTVYNIESIFRELHAVLENLKNSGQLSINTKTKEFLDSGKKKNKFSEQISFSINSTTKQIVANESELTKKEKQIEFNTILMESILWLSTKSSLENEKNKYIVMDDPCEYKTKTQATENPNQISILLENCKKEMEMDVSLQDLNIEWALKDQQQLLISTEFDNFLIKNRDFWYEVNDMFVSLSNTAKALSLK